MSVIRAESAIRQVTRHVQDIDDEGLHSFVSWVRGNPGKFNAVVDAALDRPADLERLMQVGIPVAGIARRANQHLNRGLLGKATNGVMDAVHGSKMLKLVPGKVFGMRPHDAMGAASQIVRFGREQRPLADQLLENASLNPEGGRLLAQALREHGDDIKGVVAEIRARPAMRDALAEFVDALGR